jgi:hypothetical protein
MAESATANVARKRAAKPDCLHEEDDETTEKLAEHSDKGKTSESSSYTTSETSFTDNNVKKPQNGDFRDMNDDKFLLNAAVSQPFSFIADNGSLQRKRSTKSSHAQSRAPEKQLNVAAKEQDTRPRAKKRERKRRKKAKSTAVTQEAPASSFLQQFFNEKNGSNYASRAGKKEGKGKCVERGYYNYS